jgi:hypothetical protein
MSIGDDAIRRYDSLSDVQGVVIEFPGNGLLSTRDQMVGGKGIQ